MSCSHTCSHEGPSQYTNRDTFSRRHHQRLGACFAGYLPATPHTSLPAWRRAFFSALPAAPPSFMQPPPHRQAAVQINDQLQRRQPVGAAQHAAGALGEQGGGTRRCHRLPYAGRVAAERHQVQRGEGTQQAALGPSSPRPALVQVQGRGPGRSTSSGTQAPAAPRSAACSEAAPLRPRRAAQWTPLR